MKTSDLRGLLETLEEARRDLYPDLDAEFLKAVIMAEEQNPEDEGEALRGIQVAVDTALANKGE